MDVQLSIRRRVHLMGIGVVALSAIAYQVLLTRIFSVVLYYHFAFVGISLAMLGLTIGAIQVLLHKERYSAERVNREWASAALGFSVSSALLVLFFLYLPVMSPILAKAVT